MKKIKYLFVLILTVLIIPFNTNFYYYSINFIKDKLYNLNWIGMLSNEFEFSNKEMEEIIDSDNNKNITKRNKPSELQKSKSSKISTVQMDEDGDSNIENNKKQSLNRMTKAKYKSTKNLSEKNKPNSKLTRNTGKSTGDLKKTMTYEEDKVNSKSTGYNKISQSRNMKKNTQTIKKRRIK